MTFSAFRTSYSRKPLFYIGQIPMDMTNLLVSIHLVTALFFTFASGGWYSSPWIGQFIFSPSALLDFKIWTLATYPFVHDLNLWFALGLYFFWRFGGDLESVLGTKRFGILYAAVTIVPALGLFALSPLVGNLPLIGDGSPHLAIFISFALVYPAAVVWFGIPIKWFVIAIVGIQTLQYLGYKSWGGLAALWLSILTAFTYLHFQGVRSCHSITGWLSRKTNIYISFKSKNGSKSTKQRSRRARAPSINRDKRVDAILDKISRNGFQSLTDEERAILNESSSRYNNRKG